MKILLISFTTVGVVVVNVFWYKIKFILDENDYFVSYFYSHLTDIPNFIKLIIKEKDKGKKKKYIKLLLFLLVSIGIAVVSFVILIRYFE